MPMYDMKCWKCGDVVEVFRHHPPEPELCLCGKGLRERTILPSKRRAVTPDEIPGGILIHHGLCNEDGTPKRYYSNSEIARAAKEKGWEPHVCNLGPQDKHVPSWGGITQHQLDEAAALVKRVNGDI